MRHRADLAGEVSGQGYGWIDSAGLDLTPEELGSREDLARMWDHLIVDQYLETAVRLRRYSRYLIDASPELVRLPHAPYRQEGEHNPLFGDQDRVFEPCPPEMDQNPYFMGLTGLLRHALPATHSRWTMHAHMVRIPTLRNQAGEPVPEGPHRDGFDYIAIYMIGRTGVAGGETAIYEAGEEVATATLREPGDGLILDDKRFTHDTTPITLMDGFDTGSRDVLLFSFDPAPA